MTNANFGRAEGSEVERLRATERERLQALVSGDVARAAQLHADDFQLINPLGGALSKAQYLGGISSGQIHYVHWEPETIAVRMYGDAAIMRYQSELEIVVQGRHIPRQRYWHTDLYELHGSQWQVVWSHATAATWWRPSRVARHLTRKCSRQARAGRRAVRARLSRWPSSGSVGFCGREDDRLQLICTSFGRTKDQAMEPPPRRL